MTGLALRTSLGGWGGGVISTSQYMYSAVVVLSAFSEAYLGVEIHSCTLRRVLCSHVHVLHVRLRDGLHGAFPFCSI